MSCPSTVLEALMSVFRPPPSLSLRTRPFTSTRKKPGRLLPVWGALRSQLPSAVHSLTAVTAHNMGFEPSYLPAADAGAAAARHASVRLRPAAWSLFITNLLVTSSPNSPWR
jgi:hypothetical protein